MGVTPQPKLCRAGLSWAPLGSWRFPGGHWVGAFGGDRKKESISVGTDAVRHRGALE